MVGIFVDKETKEGDPGATRQDPQRGFQEAQQLLVGILRSTLNGAAGGAKVQLLRYLRWNGKFQQEAAGV